MYKTNFYGVSEVSNTVGNSIKIPLPLKSDNGKFELALYKEKGRATRGVLKIKNTEAFCLIKIKKD